MGGLEPSSVRPLEERLHDRSDPVDGMAIRHRKLIARHGLRVHVQNRRAVAIAKHMISELLLGQQYEKSLVREGSLGADNDEVETSDQSPLKIDSLNTNRPSDHLASLGEISLSHHNVASFNELCFLSRAAKWLQAIRLEPPISTSHFRLTRKPSPGIRSSLR